MVLPNGFPFPAFLQSARLPTKAGNVYLRAVAYWGQKKVKIESTLESLGTIESGKREKIKIISRSSRISQSRQKPFAFPPRNINKKIGIIC